MQTSLPEGIKQTIEGQEADAILRACVHCGFCNATCPTYQLLGDELDGPRGRIYLIKQALEGQAPGPHTQLHLDRCLTCRSCETTCPSGVRYGRLLEIGRSHVEARVPRPWWDRGLRWALRQVLPYRRRFTPLARLGQGVRLLLPGRIKQLVPPRQSAGEWPGSAHIRQALVFEGCVQPGLAPNINAATARVLDRLGISPRAAGGGCCGAISHHLAADEEAREQARRNIDAWWPQLSAGAEALVVNASACASMLKEYPTLLQDDPQYRDKAERVAASVQELGAYLADQPDLTTLTPVTPRRLAWHAPCTLQHGQGLAQRTRELLGRLGHQLTPVPDAHLCCGAAGTYTLLQRDLSRRLQQNKVTALESGEPEVIVSANIGCLLQVAGASTVPVQHWVELVDRGMPVKST